MSTRQRSHACNQAVRQMMMTLSNAPMAALLVALAVAGTGLLVPCDALSQPAAPEAAQTREVAGTASAWMGQRLRLKLSASDKLGTGILFGFASDAKVTRDGKPVSPKAILPGDKVRATVRKTDRGWMAIQVSASATAQSKAGGGSDVFGGGDPFAAAPANPAPSAPPAKAAPSAPPAKAAPSGSKGSGGMGSGGLGGDLGDALGDLGGPSKPAPKPKKRQMSRSQAIEGIIRACRNNPNQKGCRNLRNACRNRRWKGDMLRICPGLGVSRRRARRSTGRVYIDPKRRKIVRACRQRPSHRSCVKLRRLCRQGYSRLDAKNRWVCDQLGAGRGRRGGGGGGGSGGGDMGAVFGDFSLSLSQTEHAGKPTRLWGGHLELTSIPRRGILAYSFDMDLAKGGPGWLWDVSLNYGVGKTHRRRFAWRVTGGIRGSGWMDGGMETAWSVPVTLELRAYLSRSLVASVSVRPAWNIGGAASRDGASSLLPFADELRVTAGVVWGRQRRALGVGLFIGARYQEMGGARFLTAQFGMGYTSKP